MIPFLVVSFNLSFTRIHLVQILTLVISKSTNDFFATMSEVSDIDKGRGFISYFDSYFVFYIAQGKRVNNAKHGCVLYKTKQCKEWICLFALNICIYMSK